jgi:hypothetical protein
MRALLSKGESANILACSRPTAVRRLGKPCAIILNGRREVPAYQVARVMAYRAGQVIEPPDEPLAFYSMLEAARRLEVCRYKLKPLLGSPDCVYVAAGGRELPCWSQDSLNASFILIGEARRAGDLSFDRVRPFRRRMSAKQRRRAQLRKMNWRSLKLPKPISRVRMVQALHRWANPKDVAACRVRK